MHPNAELLTGFYAAFAAKDGASMATAYAADAQFSDPVFTDLRGSEVGAMWQMLCSRAADLHIEASAITADDENGSAHWEAWYTFSKTGGKVHNVIDATFEFRDGRIITGGGVTAGLDFAFTVLAELAGDDYAQAVQLGLEYAPAPPFNAGRPEIAPPQVLAAYNKRMGPTVAGRRAAAQEAARRLQPA